MVVYDKETDEMNFNKILLHYSKKLYLVYFAIFLYRHNFDKFKAS